MTEFVLRQEVVALAVKLMNIYIPDNYACRGLFADVTATRPNSWVCRIAENALEKGIVKVQGNTFKPEESITLVDAVEIILRAGNIKIQKFSGGEFEPWQANVIGTTFSLGLVENRFDFSATRKAMRGDIFGITRKILELPR